MEFPAVSLSDRKLDLVASGSITIDQIIRVDRLPRKHFEATIESSYPNCWGGRAPNVAVMLAKLGHKTAIVSPVGSDFPESGYLDHLKSLQIDTGGLTVIPTMKTMHTIIVTDCSHNQVTLLEIGAADHFRKMRVPTDLIANSRIVHISSSGCWEFNVAVARASRKRGSAVSFDVGNDPFTESRTYLPEMIKNVDLLFLNDVEMESLERSLGIDSPQRLLSFGPTIVAVIAKEDKSSFIYSEEGVSETPPMTDLIPDPNGIIDPTGTSDAYVTGFLAGALKGYGIEECGLLAAAEASFIAEAVGCQTNLPTWNLLIERARISRCIPSKAAVVEGRATR